jgi:hypothetical protein
MPKNDPLNTAEYYQFVQSPEPNAEFTYSVDEEVKRTVEPISFGRVEKNNPIQYIVDPEDRISIFHFDSKTGDKSFIRIINVNDFIPKSDVALTLTAEDYRLLQQLGITQHTDQTLTAKTIGILGDYRLRVLKDQEQYGLRTTLFHEKETICQHAFARLYALQEIECAFGRDFKDVKKAISNYKEKLNSIEGELNALAQSEYSDIAEMITNSLSKALPLVQLRNKLKETTEFDKKLFLRRYIDLAEDMEKAEKLQDEINRLEEINPHASFHPIHGLDATKFPIEQFVRSTTNKIIDDAKLANELVTIANGDSLFRGVFEKHLGKAEIHCVNFTFNQNKLIEPEHGGNFSKQKKVVVLSSETVGHGREGVRKFLFAASYILHKDDDKRSDPFLAEDKNFSVSKTRGWTRLFRRERLGREIFNTYNQLRNMTAKASISRLRGAFEDIGDIGDLLTRGLSKAARGILSAFGREFYKVGTDFVVQPSTQQQTQEYHANVDDLLASRSWTAEDKISLSDTEFKLVMDDNYKRWSEKEKINYIFKTLVKGLEKTEPLTKGQRKVVEMFRAKDNGSSVPLALPPSSLSDTNPKGSLSSLMGGLETFYRMFDELYEVNPSTTLYCSLLYGMAGLAVVNPKLTLALFEKIKLKAIAQPFITWNTATANAMTRGDLSNFISAGFTAWQQLFLVSQTLSESTDSITGDMCRMLCHHLPKVIGAAAAAYGLGYAVTTDLVAKIPGIGDLGQMIKEDAGNQPYIEEFFAGVKLGTLAYEALESKPTEQSALASLISLALKIALFPVRLFVTSPINLLLAIHNPAHLRNAAAPWIELAFTVKSAVLSTSDAVLRGLNITGQATKRMFKTVTEWFANTLTIVIKLAARPFVNPKNNSAAAWIITAKTRLLAFFGKPTRGLKDTYRYLRNGIARELCPERSSSAAVIAGLQIDPKSVQPRIAPEKKSDAPPLVRVRAHSSPVHPIVSRPNTSSSLRA